MTNRYNFRQISLKAYLWLTETRGVTAIETGIIVSSISGVLASVGLVFGDDLTSLFDNMNHALDAGTLVKFENP
jgi:Flp pilus assembly pilin Flp